MHFTRVGVCSVLALVVLVGCENETKGTPNDAGGMDVGTDDSGRVDASDSAIDEHDAGVCIPPVVATACEGSSEGWFAIKTTIDVWWQGTTIHDPGRDDVLVYALARLNDDCSGTGNDGDIKLCGLTLPTITSDLGCDAFDLKISDVTWDSAVLPRVRITRTASMFEPGAVATIDHLSALHGIDLVDGSEGEAWPTTTRAADIMCEAGVGAACFPDHDNDGLPGVTLRPRTDGASNLPRDQRTTYVGPYGDGKCASTVEYKYQAMPASDCRCQAGNGTPVLAQEIYMGIGVGLGGPITLSAACTSGTGSVSAPFIEMRAVGCKVDAQSPYPLDPRLQTGDLTCTADELQFLQDTMPMFRTLRAGEMPGESQRLLGWQLIARDIDKRVSEGAKVSMVRLGDLGANEPTCATVRAVAFPTL